MSAAEVASRIEEAQLALDDFRERMARRIENARRLCPSIPWATYVDEPLEGR